MENTGTGQLELILFYSPTCAACKSYMRSFDIAAGDVAKKATIRKININEDSSLNNQYGLTAVPTTVLVNNGTVIEKFVGEMNSKRIKHMVYK